MHTGPLGVQIDHLSIHVPTNLLAYHSRHPPSLQSTLSILASSQPYPTQPPTYPSTPLQSRTACGL